ncbi:MAG: OmpA/MotB family protein [Pseudomonadota bacterium]
MSDLEQAASRVARRSDSLRIPLVSSAEEDGWLITYLDVITLLLVMFVVMLALSGGPSDTPGSGVVQRMEVETVNEPLAETTVPEMATEPVNPAAEFAGRALSFLQEAGLSDEVEVIEQEGGVSLRVSSEILFASGAATLTNQGIDQLEKLVPLLAESDYRITVAGHTDNVAVRSQRFPSNWELSSARAGSVVRLFEADGIPSSRMQATGYADTRPLARNDTERGRARNRRVELVLQPPVDNTD